MSSLISTPVPADLRVAGIGQRAPSIVEALGLTISPLESSDLAIFVVGAKDGIDSEGVAAWNLARDLYIPSLVVIDQLLESEIDFDDMSAIAGRLLDPVVTPYLVLHSDEGSPIALINLDSLQLSNYSGGAREITESDPEHKVLVFEFRKEYLEALAAAGEGAFQQGLLYPAIPYLAQNNLGLEEIAQYARQIEVLPGRS